MLDLNICFLTMMIFNCLIAATSTPTACTLSCQNGGVLNTDGSCECHCLEYTSGKECEQGERGYNVLNRFVLTNGPSLTF